MTGASGSFLVLPASPSPTVNGTKIFPRFYKSRIDDYWFLCDETVSWRIAMKIILFQETDPHAKKVVMDARN